MKVKLSAIIVLIVCFYLLVGFIILSPILTFILVSPFILYLGILFTVILLSPIILLGIFFDKNWKGVFSYFSDEEARSKWLWLHGLFGTVIIFCVPLTMSASIAMLFFGFSLVSFAGIFLFTWVFLLLSILALYSLNKVLGMGYYWFAKASRLGIQTYSSCATRYIDSNDRKGFLLLKQACYLLQEDVKQDGLEVEGLEECLKLLTCYEKYSLDLPFTLIKSLCTAVEKYPNLQNISSVLVKFKELEEQQWTRHLKSIKVKSRRKTEKVVIGLLAILSGIAAFLPEEAKTQIVSTMSPSIALELMIGVASLFGVFYMIFSSGDAMLITYLTSRKYKSLSKKNN